MILSMWPLDRSLSGSLLSPAILTASEHMATGWTPAGDLCFGKLIDHIMVPWIDPSRDGTVRPFCRKDTSAGGGNLPPPHGGGGRGGWGGGERGASAPKSSEKFANPKTGPSFRCFGGGACKSLQSTLRRLSVDSPAPKRKPKIRGFRPV
jgi:hypothetical protein